MHREASVHDDSGQSTKMRAAPPLLSTVRSLWHCTPRSNVPVRVLPYMGRVSGLSEHPALTTRRSPGRCRGSGANTAGTSADIPTADIARTGHTSSSRLPRSTADDPRLHQVGLRWLLWARASLQEALLAHHCVDPEASLWIR
jgi:hypothetical protein